jgi:hypothetical protein
LAVTDQGWLACNSDFTKDSPWLVATSTDAGNSFTPELTFGDLATVTSCGDICATTSAWLYGVFGSGPVAPSGGPGRDLDASLPPAPDSGRNETPDEPAPRKSNGDSGFCAMRLGTHQFGLGWVGILLAVGFRRSTHRRRE